MTLKYIHAALPLILSLMATTAQALPTQADARPAVCARYTERTECSEPMSVYGRPFAPSHENAEARAEIRKAERSFASHGPAARSRDEEDPFASMHFE